MTFHLNTTAFPDAAIPKKFTCDGPDLSPPLAWTDPPKGTESLALIVDDPDAPAGTWVHWVLYDIPADTRELSEGVPKTRSLPNGARQGRNDFGKIGYNGPCPPRGRVHHYSFKLYSLDSMLNLGPGATKAQLQRAIGAHVLAQTEIIGRFQH
jgi:Raf kinase inhibitor-like YbhB/YbcL family protein